MIWMTGAAWIVAKVCLVCMFPFSAADKVWHWSNAHGPDPAGWIRPAPSAAMLGGGHGGRGDHAVLHRVRLV